MFRFFAVNKYCAVCILCCPGGDFFTELVERSGRK